MCHGVFGGVMSARGWGGKAQACRGVFFLVGVLWRCPGGGFEVALAGPHPWSGQQWKGRAGSDDDDDSSDGDGTVIVVPLECSIGLATSIASRAA